MARESDNAVDRGVRSGDGRGSGGGRGGGDGGGGRVSKRRRSGARFGGSGRGGRRRGRGDGGKPRAKTQEELDFEMDLLAVERDGGDVDALKEAFKAKMEEARKAAAIKRDAERKAKLDSQMDSYFEDKQTTEKEKADEGSAGGGVDLSSKEPRTVEPKKA